MMPGSRYQQIILAGLLAVAVAVPVIGWKVHRQQSIIHARIAEAGGWMPRDLVAEVGKPLHLRFTSDDVMHGFAVGKMDSGSVDIRPGEISEITLIFERPGRYTFYCTRWCSLNHWRMRGVIEVLDPGGSPAPAETPPLYTSLGLDLDAEHHSQALPENKPSASRGSNFEAFIPGIYRSQDYYRSHSPEEVFQALRSEVALVNFSDAQLWDMVAWAWASQTSSGERQQGKELYSDNCAACHGEEGAGDGVYAGESEAIGDDQAVESGTDMRTNPTDFTNPEHMLGASPAILQGKILRGGMGTGMPSWGKIFRDDQSWALVAYLWTFQFDMEVLH